MRRTDHPKLLGKSWQFNACTADRICQRSARLGWRRWSRIPNAKLIAEPLVLAQEGATVRKQMPTEAEAKTDPARPPKMVRQRQPPHQEFANVAGRHRQQEQQNERER